MVSPKSLSKHYTTNGKGETLTKQTRKLYKNLRRRTTYALNFPAIKILNSASYNRTHTHGSPLAILMTPTPTKRCPACQLRQSKIRITQPGRRSAEKMNSPFCPKELPRVKHRPAQILASHQDPQSRPRYQIRLIVSNINGPTSADFMASRQRP